MPGIDDAARDELRLTLHVVPRWKLNEAGWGLVEAQLHEVKRALESGDRSAFFRQLERLDRLGPARLGRLDVDDALNHASEVVPPRPSLSSS